MSERHQRVGEALAQIGDSWDAVRSERNLPGVRRRLEQRRKRGTALATAAAGLLALAAWLAWPQPRAAELAALPAAQPRHTQFADGSVVELLDPSARMVVDEVSDGRVAVQLLAGSLRADVTPRKERTFRVHAGEVTVEVLGTAFEVTREAARTHVLVLRGRVAVHWGQSSVQLAAGEAGWFPKVAAEPVVQQPAAAEAEPQQPSAAKQRKNARHGLPRAEPSWQAQAERGDFAGAYELMPRAPERVADDVEELLLAADAARLSGHPNEALPFLRRVIERHAHDPRASLAAFTLGNLLLNQLERPLEAEAAYARARTLALSPALAQDALARQVEAAQHAGDAARTRTLAEEYLRRYPDGRRVQWVRELSGVAP